MIYCCYIRKPIPNNKKIAIYQLRFDLEINAIAWVQQQNPSDEAFYRAFKCVIKVALVSGGRESAAMVIRLGVDFFDVKVFADTGDDPTALLTVQHMNKYHNWNVHIVYKKDENGNQIKIRDFYANKFVQDEKTGLIGHALPIRSKKDCTGKFKIEPEMSLLHELYGDDVFYELYYGLSFSDKEIGRMRNSGVQYATNMYPLIMQHVDRQLCGQICKNYFGFIPERTWCRMCFEKTPKDWKDMWRNNKEEMLKIIKFEESSLLYKQYGYGLNSKPLSKIIKLKKVDQTTLTSCGCVKGDLSDYMNIESNTIKHEVTN